MSSRNNRKSSVIAPVVFSYLPQVTDKTPTKFLEELIKLHETQYTPFRHTPTVLGRKINLMRMYNEVARRGGIKKMTTDSAWEEVMLALSVPLRCSNAIMALRSIYQRYLEPYERLHRNKATINEIEEELQMESESPSVHPRYKARDMGGHSSQFINGHYHHGSSSGAGGSGSVHHHSQHYFNLVHPVSMVYHADTHQLPAHCREAAGLSTQLAQPTEMDRLELALRSGLHNEIELALNALLLMSCQPDSVHLNRNPRLLDCLLAAVGLCDRDAIVNLSKYDRKMKRFIQYWNDTISDGEARKYLHPSIFDTGTESELPPPPMDPLISILGQIPGDQMAATDDLGARVLLVATLLRNLLLDSDPNCQLLSQTPHAIRMILLLAHSSHTALRQLGLELLALLRFPVGGVLEPTLLQLLPGLVDSEDRFDRLRGLEIVSRLSDLKVSSDNLGFFNNLPDSFYSKLIANTILHDLYIVVLALEAVFCISEIDGLLCCRLVDCSHELLPTLCTLLSLEAQVMGTQSLVRIRVMQGPTLISAAPGPAPSTHFSEQPVVPVGPSEQPMLLSSRLILPGPASASTTASAASTISLHQFNSSLMPPPPAPTMKFSLASSSSVSTCPTTVSSAILPSSSHTSVVPSPQTVLTSPGLTQKSVEPVSISSTNTSSSSNLIATSSISSPSSCAPSTSSKPATPLSAVSPLRTGPSAASTMTRASPRRVTGVPNRSDISAQSGQHKCSTTPSAHVPVPQQSRHKTPHRGGVAPPPRLHRVSGTAPATPVTVHCHTFNPPRHAAASPVIRNKEDYVRKWLANNYIESPQSTVPLFLIYKQLQIAVQSYFKDCEMVSAEEFHKIVRVLFPQVQLVQLQIPGGPSEIHYFNLKESVTKSDDLDCLLDSTTKQAKSLLSPVQQNRVPCTENDTKPPQPSLTTQATVDNVAPASIAAVPFSNTTINHVPTINNAQNHCTTPNNIHNSDHNTLQKNLKRQLIVNGHTEKENDQLNCRNKKMKLEEDTKINFTNGFISNNTVSYICKAEKICSNHCNDEVGSRAASDSEMRAFSSSTVSPVHCDSLVNGGTDGSSDGGTQESSDKNVSATVVAAAPATAGLFGRPARVPSSPLATTTSSPVQPPSAATNSSKRNNSIPLGRTRSRYRNSHARGGGGVFGVRSTTGANKSRSYNSQRPHNLPYLYICEWDNCLLSFDKPQKVYGHVYTNHFMTLRTEVESKCLWARCKDKTPRTPLPLLNHVNEQHCNNVDLESARQARLSKTDTQHEPQPAQQEGQVSEQPAPQPAPPPTPVTSSAPTVKQEQQPEEEEKQPKSLEPPVSPATAAAEPPEKEPSMRLLSLTPTEAQPIQPQRPQPTLQLYQHSAGPQQPSAPAVTREPGPVREGPVTKHIRYMSAMILRNLCRHSPSARHFVAARHSHLFELSISGCESARALAECLFYSSADLS